MKLCILALLLIIIRSHISGSNLEPSFFEKDIFDPYVLYKIVSMKRTKSHILSPFNIQFPLEYTRISILPFCNGENLSVCTQIFFNCVVPHSKITENYIARIVTTELNTNKDEKKRDFF